MRKANWGEDPEFFGPRDYFRNSLLISEIVKRKSKGKILDFGCGSGNLLIRLARKGYKCVGVDKSRTATSYLKEQIKKMALGNISQVIIGDENTLAKLGNNFDLIVSGETLEHIKDEGKVVKGFYECLGPSGVVVVSVPAKMGLWNINDDYSSHFRRYSLESLSKIFTSNRFRVLKKYYWGFPLSTIWERLIYLPLIQEKIKSRVIYSKSKGILYSFMKVKFIQMLASWVFYFDNLFNWTGLGGGAILVAKKKGPRG